MHPFTLERPRELSTALAFRAQAGRNDATAETSPAAPTWCSSSKSTSSDPSGS